MANIRSGHLSGPSGKYTVKNVSSGHMANNWIGYIKSPYDEYKNNGV